MYMNTKLSMAYGLRLCKILSVILVGGIGSVQSFPVQSEKTKTLFAISGTVTAEKQFNYNLFTLVKLYQK